MLSEVIANKVQHIIQKAIDEEASSLTLKIEVKDAKFFTIEQVGTYITVVHERSEIDG